MISQEPRRRSRQLAWVILALYLVLQLAGLKSAPLTDDDDFYIPAGTSYAAWLGGAITLRGVSKEAVDRAFEPNHEHPPLAKYVFGICHFAFRRLLGPSDAARVGTVLFSTLAAAMLLFMALDAFGPERGLRVGGLSVLALLTLPRFYFHSHAATLDIPVAAMMLATTFVLLRAERSTRAAIWAGPVFGLAMGTKLNAPFLLVAYGVFVLLTRPPAPKRDDQSGLRLPTVPLALISMLILGPLVFWAIWPWIWFDTFARIAGYVGFHLHHYGIYFLYFGRVFVSDPFAPWHAPFVMAAITTPLVTLVLAIAGVGRALRPIFERIRRRTEAAGPERASGDLLLIALLNLGLHISVVAFAGTPIYGGEKLFSPFFPFLCLFAGFGANALVEQLEAVLPLAERPRRRVALAIGVVLAGSGLALMLRFGGYPLSSYNGLIGGLRGATARGFERQYYDLAFRDLSRWISENAPPGAKVHFLPNNWEYVRTYRWYQKAGEVRPDLVVTDNESLADWIIITHERRFARYGDDLQRYRTSPVILEKMLDGVPIWSIVEGRRGAR